MVSHHSEKPQLSDELMRKSRGPNGLICRQEPVNVPAILTHKACGGTIRPVKVKNVATLCSIELLALPKPCVMADFTPQRIIGDFTFLCFSWPNSPMLVAPLDRAAEYLFTSLSNNRELWTTNDSTKAMMHCTPSRVWRGNAAQRSSCDATLPNSISAAQRQAPSIKRSVVGAIQKLLPPHEFLNRPHAATEIGQKRIS